MKKLLITAALCAIAPHASFGDILTLQAFGFAGGQVVRYDELTGAQVPGWSFNPQGVNPSVGQLSGLETHNGVGYVSSLNTGQVLQFDLASGAPIGSGVFATLPQEPDDPRLSEDPPRGPEPSALRVGPDGLLYVADGFGTSILRYNLQTGALVDRVVDGLAGVGGIGFSSTDALLSTSNTLGSGLNTIYTGGGDPPSVLTPGAATNLYGPNSLLVNADDSFLVTDLLSNYIFRFGADGSPQGPFAEIEYPSDVDPMNPPIGASFSSNFPSDMRRDAEGNVLVVNLGISSVVQGAAKNYGSLLRYAPDGTLIERLADSLFAPSSIALVDGLTGTPGDFNRDGLVDAGDYAMWTAGLGRQVTPGSNADGNFDGVIDAADYTVWRDNLPAPLDASAASVPEPASEVLALAALLAGVGYRTRRGC
ncbi:hypothetical protein Pla175_07850 [Pirellulimonas nuda]|uniref:Ice-binding protein C-terminal domain-containing protein n=1 Tax=Pirellulimonas nuda TaxID=2528009 RepID=A0A518D7J7_9BACT|nr:dockerin type I domain-containing protein [Pirellulimonas nuda]QDU87425.1 hypothetical protein Pla175_07850 [Pirellulimonas nuda]